MQRSDAVYDKTFDSPASSVIKRLLSNGKLVYLRAGKPTITQKTGESVKQFYKRISDIAAAGKLEGRANLVKNQSAVRETVTDWSDNWFKENFKKDKYKPRDVSKFVNNYKNDWQKEIKTKGYKDLPNFPYKDSIGFPPVSTRKEKYKIPGSVFSMQPNFKGNKKNQNFGEKSIRKAFFENQLKTNKEFKNHLDDYFNFFLKNKSGAGNQYKKVILPKGAADAVFWLSPDSGIFGTSRSDMFEKIPGYNKIYSDYVTKFNKRGSSVRNQKFLEKTLNLGSNYFRNLQRKEGEALKKLFDVTELPRELTYSVEHAQGLASAIASGDKKIMQAAVDDLAGMSLGRNMELGYAPGVFERTRKQFINKISDGLKNKQNMSKEVNQLNKFIFEEYGGNVSRNKKPYSIINNKLQTSVISDAKTQTERFGQYFNELAQKPEGAPKLLEQVTTKPELEKFIKEGKGSIYNNLRKTLITAAENNEGNICQLFRNEGGRIGFATGSGCPKQMEMAFDDNPVKLSQDINKLPYEEGPINKIKNSATKFLQSPMLRSAGKYGAIAAGGAVAAGFVKKFMNDDPTTYLSNEEQQKNLLMDMVTGSLDDTPQESPAIGDAYLPALGAATVAGTAAVAPSTIDAVRGGALGAKKSGITKTALKVLGKGLTATQTPLGLLATEPLYLADQIQQGDSLGEIATNPFNYMGAAFVGPATEFATKGGLSPMIAKTMRLGISPNVLKTVSRRFGLPGLALSLGISGYETYDDFKNKRGFFSDEE